MGPLDMATLDELLDELKRRSMNTLIYMEGVGKDLGYVIGWRGDLMRLYGSMQLRVMPYLRREYRDLTEDSYGED